MNHLPLDTTEIYAEWHGENCGLGITAYMEEGQSYIGLYPLNCAKTPSGAPIFFKRQRLIVSDWMIGYVKGKPLCVYLDADISARGLDVRILAPVGEPKLKGEAIHRWAHWGSPAPRYYFFPSNQNWPIAPILRSAPIL